MRGVSNVALSGLVAAAMALGGSLAGATQAAAQDIPAINLVVSDLSQPGSAGARAWEAYAEAVGAASGGRITFEFFLASALLPPAEQGEGIGAGTATMGTVLTPYTPALFPVANWMVGFGLLPTGGVPYSNAYGSAGNNEAHLQTPELMDEFAAVGLQVIGTWYNQSFDMLCTKPVNDLAEARGTRIRTGGQLWSLETQALDMIPVPLVPTEIYEGFSRGIVDCLSLHPNGYLDMGVLGIAGSKYYVPLEMAGWNTQFVTVNKAVWDAMPAAAHLILRENLPLFFQKQFEGQIAKHLEFAQAVKDQGIEVLNPEPDLVDALQAFHDKYLADMITTAPPALKDPAAVVERAKASIEKWRRIADESGLTPAPENFAEREAYWTNAPDVGPFMQKFSEALAAADQ